MRKINFKILTLHGIVFLLGLACSAMSLGSYVAAQGLLAPAPTTPAPVPTAAVKPSPTPIPTPMPAPASALEDSRIEYYRGIFDICVSAGKRSDVPADQVVEACRTLVRRAIEQNWFESPSQGWKWPLPVEFAELDQNG